MVLAGLLAGAAACGSKTPPATPGAAAGAPVAPEPIFDVSKSKPTAPCPDEPADQMPPANSPPMVRCVELQFHPVNQSMIDAATYGYYIKTRGSPPNGPTWMPYNEDQLQADWTALWKTNFLDNLWIQTIDEPYPNGVMGKHVVFHFEERAKLKGVEYPRFQGRRHLEDRGGAEKEGPRAAPRLLRRRVDRAARQRRRQAALR